MNVLKRSICMLLVAVMVLSLVACAAKTATPTTEAPAEKTTEAVATTETASADTAEETTAVSTEETEAEDAPVMLNVMGYDVVFEKAPERVAIGNMENAAILVALGLEDKIVGYTNGHFKIEEFPEEFQPALSRLHLFGSDATFETILAEDIDFVFGSSWHFNDDGLAPAKDCIANNIGFYCISSGVTGMARWLLLVVVFVLVVAGIGVAYLYRSATPDMLPSISVTFAGQTLEPSAYKWHVPVIGNWFKRTYAETYSSVPAVLEAPISTLSPDITISSTNYATQLTVTDANKETVFEGTLSEFSGYCFDETGTYTAKLVASVTGSRAAGAADITGSETWLFTFDIAIEPSVYLSENTIEQGGVAAIRVTGSYEDDAPTLTTTLKNQGFIQSSNGWVCYLPIPWNAALGTETIDVQVGRYSTTLYLKVTDGGFSYKDYSSQSQRATPYIGQDDAPTKVSKLFTAAPTGISWADAGFVQPFLNRLNTTLTFGATEYVGRRYSERSTNTGAGGRTSTNVILSTTRGELVIAPASGKIDLAEDLGGDYGITLVIDHGAGVRTIFYGLSDIDIKAGQQVKQGQTLATCGKTTVVEMRIGTVPIDPIAVWRGQCNGLKYY